MGAWGLGGYVMQGVGWLSVCSMQSGIARGNVYWVLGIRWCLVSGGCCK